MTQNLLYAGMTGLGHTLILIGTGSGIWGSVYAQRLTYQDPFLLTVIIFGNSVVQCSDMHFINKSSVCQCQKNAYSRLIPRSVGITPECV